MSFTPETLYGPELPPASGNAPKQLVVLMHGYGADGNDLIGLAPELGKHLPDAHFLSPHAPFPCEMAPFGRQWYSLRSFEDSWLLKGSREVAGIVNFWLDEQLKRFHLTESSLLLAGFSQGCMISLYTALRREKPCAGVLGFSGALVGADVLAEEIKSRPPVCLIHGEEDGVVPFMALTHAETALKAAGVPVETHARPGLAHGIDPKGLGIGIAFARKVLLTETVEG